MPRERETRLKRELDLAVSTAREAGEFLRSALSEVRNIAYKGVSDLVTDADIASENLIRERLLSAFPDDRFLGEESSDGMLPVRSGRCWIVDPLDGTTNYAHGYPIFAVAIALVIDGSVQVGVVYAPMLDDLFVGVRGAGAVRNGVSVHVSSVELLDDALVATGFAYDPGSRLDNMPHWSNFVAKSQAVRRSGAASLDISWVGCGWLDGFWERNLSPWDVAAGSLIVEEAGGRLSGYQGQDFDLFSRELVAANAKIHPLMLREIASIKDSADREARMEG